MNIQERPYPTKQTIMLPANRPGAIARAAMALRAGQLIVMPTDTLYGLAGDAFIPAAIKAIFATKQRPSSKSLPILLADIDDLPRVTRFVPTIAQQFIDRYWPGPLTLILPKHPALPTEISDNDNIAVRLPDNPVARDIIRAAGGALAVTSANLSGHPAATTAAAALADLAGFVTAVVDDGPAPHTVASTILDCSGDELKILREGSISGQMLLGITQPITL